ncbi:unnamed protein product [Candidula unifasciata]|uniref:Uncharacterized protein n=1 Tax=Candidula unifasciata TaxID=100452 RepID=A0A8S3YU85_9EUPU|nr:unnamed protein product [Candidula unifasciata]
MSSVMKRSMDREGSPVSKRSRSAYLPDHDVMRARMSPTDFERRDSHRGGKYEPRDHHASLPPPPPPAYVPGYRSEFLVHDGPPPLPPPPPRPYDARGPPPPGPYPPPPRWPPENDYRSLYIMLRETLIDSYKRFGEMNVKITNSNDQRVAYLNFRYPEDAREALAKGVKFMFDRELKINPVFNKRRNNLSPSRSVPASGVSRPPPEPFYHSRHSPPPYDRRYPPPNGSQYAVKDEYRPDPSLPGALHHDLDKKNEKFPYHLDHVDPEYDEKATRTLFVGNLDVNMSDFDLRNIFGRFGLVEDVDIKRPVRNNGNAYAFVKYINLDCAHRAKCKIGYGKVTPTTVIWVGGIGPWVTVETLEREFDRFGAIQHIEWPRNKNFAYVIYDSIDAAQAACQQMRGFPLGGPDKRLRLDFGEKDHITRSHSLPDYLYPLPKDHVYSAPERPPEPWRDIPRLPDAADWQRDYRAPLPEAYRDGGRRTEEYAYDRSGERRKEQTPDYSKPSYVSQRSPERGRDYRNERGQSREFRDDRGQSRDEDRHTERRDYRAPSPREDYINNHCRTLADLSKVLPVAWNGALTLKSSAFATSMHVVSGDVRLVDTLMRDPTSTESPVLKITQRLRLDQPKLDDVSRRVEAAGPRGHCILLAMPSSLPNFEESTIQQRPLKNLVTYLKQKEAAGVISLPPVSITGKKDIGVLHAFPPCDFGFNFLKNRASKLSSESTKEDHLVIVVINGAS